MSSPILHGTNAEQSNKPEPVVFKCSINRAFLLSGDATPPTQSNNMYQIKPKRLLVEYSFPTAEGWDVTIDVEAMKMGKGNQNTQEKRDAADVYDACYTQTM